MSANPPPSHDPNKAAQMARQTSQGAAGAGKSLALMQQRLQMANTHKADATPLSAPNPLVGVPAPGPLPSAPHPPGVRPMPVAPPTQQVIPPARPKGKDFTAMANSAKHKPQQPQVVPTPVPAPAVAAPVPASRPKGKDFSAMASRIGAPVPVTSPTSTAQAARVAAARAAAGYTVPQHSQAKISQPQTVPTRPSAVPPAASVIAEQARQQRIARMKSSQKHDAASAMAKTQIASQPSPSSRRSSASSSRKASVQKALPPPSTKPTQQPSSSEGRLAPSAHATPLVGQRLKELVTSLDPHYGLDSQAETQLLQLADEFLEKVVKSAMRLAQHRGSKTMDVPDIQLVLAKQWGISVPGLGAPTFKPSRPGSRVVASSSTNKRRSSASAAGSNDATKRAKVSMAAGPNTKSAPSASQQP